MFTGLVQKIGSVKRVSNTDGGWSFEILHDRWLDDLENGESIAVQGVCLTVTSFNDTGFTADLLDETISRTALHRVGSGSKVNLERALAVGDRLGGHIVNGHVDESGVMLAIDKRGRDIALRFSCSKHLSRHSVIKGSITIDGVSLTISELGDDWIEVNIIPHTLELTTLGLRKPGDYVNLEGDIIGKYVARLMDKDNECGITEKMLSENGFV